MKKYIFKTIDESSCFDERERKYLNKYIVEFINRMKRPKSFFLIKRVNVVHVFF